MVLFSIVIYCSSCEQDSSEKENHQRNYVQAQQQKKPGVKKTVESRPDKLSKMWYFLRGEKEILHCKGSHYPSIKINLEKPNPNIFVTGAQSGEEMKIYELKKVGKRFEIIVEFMGKKKITVTPIHKGLYQWEIEGDSPFRKSELVAEEYKIDYSLFEDPCY